MDHWKLLNIGTGLCGHDLISSITARRHMRYTTPDVGRVDGMWLHTFAISADSSFAAGTLARASGATN